MKKIILCVVSCCMMLGLVACGNLEQQDGDSALVKVINASEEEIYGIGYTYYVDGEVVSSGGCCYADNSAIKVSEVFSFENQSFFDDGKRVEIELAVHNEFGTEYPCATKIFLDVQNDIPCEIVIRGNFENGFDVVVNENK